MMWKGFFRSEILIICTYKQTQRGRKMLIAASSLHFFVGFSSSSFFFGIRQTWHKFCLLL